MSSIIFNIAEALRFPTWINTKWATERGTSNWSTTKLGILSGSEFHMLSMYTWSSLFSALKSSQSEREHTYSTNLVSARLQMCGHCGLLPTRNQVISTFYETHMIKFTVWSVWVQRSIACKVEGMRMRLRFTSGLLNQLRRQRKHSFSILRYLVFRNQVLPYLRKFVVPRDI